MKLRLGLVMYRKQSFIVPTPSKFPTKNVMFFEILIGDQRDKSISLQLNQKTE